MQNKRNFLNASCLQCSQLALVRSVVVDKRCRQPTDSWEDYMIYTDTENKRTEICVHLILAPKTMPTRCTSHRMEKTHTRKFPRVTPQ